MLYLNPPLIIVFLDYKPLDEPQCGYYGEHCKGNQVGLARTKVFDLVFNRVVEQQVWIASQTVTIMEVIYQ